MEEIAADLVEHYETRTSVLEGKAMVEAMSRDICVSLFDEIIKLRPEWAGTKLTKDGKDIGWNHENGAIRIVMTGTASDRPGLQDHVYSKGQKKRLAKRFKDAKDPLKLVIVRDMWLTGFDAPCCHTMYVDKPMAGHNLMQAIARVNRVFAGKEGGLVVDYIGIAAELKNALKTYTDAKGKGTPTLKAEKALDVLLEKLDVLRGLFQGFDYSNFEGTPAEVLALLSAAANHILGLGDKNEINGKKRFLDAMAAANVAYSLCSTLDGAKELKKELAFLSAISAVLRKFDGVDKKRSAEQKHSALKQILDNAVKAEDVQDIFKMAGLERPNIGLLSDAFVCAPAQTLRATIVVYVAPLHSRRRAADGEEEPGGGAVGTAVARQDQGADADEPGAGEEIQRPTDRSAAEVSQPDDRKLAGDRGDDPDGEGHAGSDEAPRGAGAESGRGGVL